MPADGSVQEALQRIRARVDSKEHEDNAMWLVLGYSDVNTLSVVAEGRGGLDEAKEHCDGKNERYILTRQGHQVELSYTVKFAYISWTPDTLSPMRKALLTTHKGQVEDFMKPYHVSLMASDLSEMTTAAINDKVGFSSGTKIHQTEKKSSGMLSTGSRIMGQSGGAGAATYADVKRRKENIPKTAQQNTKELRFVDPAGFAAGMAAVRDDKDATDWVLVNYATSKTLQVVGTGSGGPDELATFLNDTTNCFYGLFRQNHQIDNSVTVKFGFMRWLGLQMPMVRKAKLATHRGFVNDAFGSFHFEFDLDSKDTFGVEMVTKRIQEVSMTMDHSSASNAPSMPQGYSSSITRGAVNLENANTKQASTRNDLVSTSSSRLKYTDKQELMAAIADVRDDNSATSWMLCGYPAKNTLSLVGSGSGQVDELLAACESPNEAYFGLVRVTDQIDRSTTVKFVFLKVQPDSMAAMKKASLTLIKGALDDLFAQFHVAFQVTSASELSHAILMDKVGRSSGSKNLVRN
jgi:hypothetical protein